MKCETRSSCGWKLDLKSPDVKLLAVGTSQSCIGVSWKIWPINFSLVVCHCSLYLFSKISNLFLVNRDLNHLITAKCFFFEYLLSIKAAVRWARAEHLLFNIPLLNSMQKPKSVEMSSQDWRLTSLNFPFLNFGLAERWWFTAFDFMGFNGSATSFPSFPFLL